METPTTQPVAQSFWKRPIVWVVLFALLVRLATIAIAADRINWVNERLFVVPAVHLVEGLGLTQADGLATAYRPPLYIFWLAGMYLLFGPYAEIGPAIAQAALGAFNVFLVFFIGQQLWKRNDAALAGAVLLAIHPYAAWHDVAVSYTVLAVTTSLLFAWMLLRAMERPTFIRGGLAGASAGAAVLLTTTVVPVIGLVALATLFCWRVAFQKRIVLLVAALVGFCLIWGPWAIRNAIVFHAFVPTTTETGLTLWYGNNPESPWRIPRFAHEDTPVPPETPVAHDNVTGCVHTSNPCRPALNEQEENRAFTVLATEWVKTHPGDFLRLSVWRLGQVWSPFLTPTKHVTGHTVMDMLITWGYAAWTLGLYLLSAVGAWYLWNKKRYWTTTALLAWSIIPASLYAVSLHFTRYRIPFEAVLLVFAGGGLALLVQVAKESKGLRPRSVWKALTALRDGHEM